MRTVVLLLTITGVTTLTAQEGWLIPFAAAFEPDVAGFNASFERHGLPRANARHYGWGAEIRTLVGGLPVGAMFFRTWDDVTSDLYHVRTSAGGVFGNLGLQLAPTGYLMVIPMLGVGGMSQSIRLSSSLRRGSPDVDFEELLSDPYRAASFSSGVKLTGLAALELGLLAGTVSGRYGLALRAGYLHSPFPVTWQLSNGARIKNAPEFRFGGPFFSVGLVIAPAPQTTVREL